MQKTILIRYKPHPGQCTFHYHPARFRVLNCGRRWGKTVAGANDFIRQIWAQHGEGREKTMGANQCHLSLERFIFGAHQKYVSLFNLCN